MAYFVIVYEQGPAWVDSMPMREQVDWTGHAAYVNAAMYAGLVILGGPLGEGPRHRALVIVHMESDSAVRSWIGEDPWIISGVLGPPRVEPWKLLVSNDLLDPVLAEITKPTVSS